MLKLLRRIFLITFVLIFSVFSCEIYTGYDMYENAIASLSVDGMANDVKA